MPSTFFKNSPIVIPTYRRTKVQDTWQALHPEIRPYVIFVVRSEEADIMLERYTPSKVDILPDTVKDIMSTRQYIWDKYSKAHDYFFQLDDDIGYFSKYELVNEPKRKFKCTYLGAKRSPRSSFVGIATAADQVEMFERLIQELKTGVGMTSPRPNWTFPADGPNYPSQRNVLVTGFYAFNGALLRDKLVRFDDWASCGDTNACLDVLAHGIQSTYCTDFFYNIDVLAEHSQLRANVIQDHKEMAERWSGYMKPRNTKKEGQLGALSAYTYQRKKLFENAPLAGGNKPEGLLKRFARSIQPETAQEPSNVSEASDIQIPSLDIEQLLNRLADETWCSGERGPLVRLKLKSAYCVKFKVRAVPDGVLAKIKELF